MHQTARKCIRWQGKYTKIGLEGLDCLGMVKAIQSENDWNSITGLDGRWEEKQSAEHIVVSELFAKA